MPNVAQTSPAAPAVNHHHPGVTPIQLLSGNLAHVLTHWMTLIMRDASYLGENLPPGTVSHEHAARILDTTRQVAGLTRRLSAMGKISEPNFLPGIRILPLADVIAHAATLVAEQCQRRNVEFRWIEATSSPKVLAEPDLLLACLLNLFCNALDAMHTGGILMVDMKADPRSVSLRIRDNGHGITQENLAKVCEPLFTTRPPSTATAGLGLTIVRFAITRWGGKLTIRSRAGKGVICRMTLPLAPSESPVKVEKKLTTPDTLLLVEDNTDLRKEMAESLRSVGHEVMEAATARDAILLLRKHHAKIRLALVDLVLPDRDGKAVINTVFALNPNMGVVIMSGFSRDYVRSCVRRGPWGYLQKPFETTHLLTSVRAFLNEHRGVHMTPAPSMTT